MTACGSGRRSRRGRGRTSARTAGRDPGPRRKRRLLVARGRTADGFPTFPVAPRHQRKPPGTRTSCGLAPAVSAIFAMNYLAGEVEFATFARARMIFSTFSRSFVLVVAIFQSLVAALSPPARRVDRPCGRPRRRAPRSPFRISGTPSGASSGRRPVRCRPSASSPPTIFRRSISSTRTASSPASTSISPAPSAPNSASAARSRRGLGRSPRDASADRSADAIDRRHRDHRRSASAARFLRRLHARCPARFVVRADSAATRSHAGRAEGQDAWPSSRAPPMRPILRPSFPRSARKLYPTADAARAALKSGEADAHFGDGMQLSFWLQSESAGRLLRLRRRPLSRDRASSARAWRSPCRRARPTSSARSIRRWNRSTRRASTPNSISATSRSASSDAAAQSMR